MIRYHILACPMSDYLDDTKIGMSGCACFDHSTCRSICTTGIFCSKKGTVW